MAASTRHFHYQNLSAATSTDDEGALPTTTSPRALGGGRVRPAAAADAVPSDLDKHLARFLLAEDDGGRRGWFARCRHAITGDGGESLAYFLALEPRETRNERLTMLSEAYSIFGGLFLGGTFVLYEWGFSDVIAPGPEDEWLRRQFALMLALTLCCNLFLTLWGSIMWITTIVHGSSEVMAVEARKMIGFCNVLLILTITFVSLGFVLGAQIHFGSGTPEAIAMIIIAPLIQMIGSAYITDLQLAVSPLSIFHQPAWFRAVSVPQSVFTRKGRERLRQRAREEAEVLTEKAREARGATTATEPERDIDLRSGSIETLLRRAAANLGRADVDVAPHVARLREDWFADARHLEGKGTDFLARYMPYRLAEEVHAIVRAEQAGSA